MRIEEERKGEFENIKQEINTRIGDRVIITDGADLLWEVNNFYPVRKGKSPM